MYFNLYNIFIIDTLRDFSHCNSYYTLTFKSNKKVWNLRVFVWKSRKEQLLVSHRVTLYTIIHEIK